MCRRLIFSIYETLQNQEFFVLQRHRKTDLCFYHIEIGLLQAILSADSSSNATDRGCTISQLHGDWVMSFTGEAVLRPLDDLKAFCTESVATSLTLASRIVYGSAISRRQTFVPMWCVTHKMLVVVNHTQKGNDTFLGSQLSFWQCSRSFWNLLRHQPHPQCDFLRKKQFLGATFKLWPCSQPNTISRRLKAVSQTSASL